MEIKFGANEQPVPTAAAPAVPETPTTAPAGPGVPAVLTPAGAVSTPARNPLLGEFIPGFEDIILPRLNIVQNIGKLSEHYTKGSLIFNQQDELFVPPDVVNGEVNRAATPPVLVTVLGFCPMRYVEKVVGGGKGLMVNSEAAVVASGGTLDYQEWKLKQAAGMKRFERLADAVIVIERPERFPNDESIFNYEVDGKQYVIAKWALRGTSYTNAAKRVFFTAFRTGCLMKGGYPSWSYAVSTRQESYDTGNKAWVPVCIANKKSTPAFMEFARTVLSTPPPSVGSADDGE